MVLVKYMNVKCCSVSGLRGRLRTQAIVLACKGALVLVYSLSGLAVDIDFLSFFIQASEGSTYSIVPHMNKASLGSVSLSGTVSVGVDVGAIAVGVDSLDDCGWLWMHRNKQ